MTCSSFTSARSADSSMPPTEPVAAVRSVMATASASSSSSSSGGNCRRGQPPGSNCTLAMTARRRGSSAHGSEGGSASLPPARSSSTSPESWRAMAWKRLSRLRYSARSPDGCASSISRPSCCNASPWARVRVCCASTDRCAARVLVPTPARTPSSTIRRALCASCGEAVGRGDSARRNAASMPALSLSRSSTSRRPARSAITTPSTWPALVAPTATSTRSGWVCCSCWASALEAAACSGRKSSSTRLWPPR
ncbi:hypothetical protein G6F31_016408 [Rhizopus arrhizus]|nr:hypothetical protein G6F31_016408 [Rhizopus arrhizus]